MERIGHRGAKRELPENTLAAFQRAFEHGADAIELDVHATRDGEVVVHHDPTLGGSAAGLRGHAIAGLSWAELSAVELAKGVGIPRLADVLTATPAGRTVYVEIKGVGIEALVAAALVGSPTRCAVHAFDHEAVRRMRTLAPELPRGILLDESPADIEQLMSAAGARDVWPDWTLIGRDLVDRVHAAGGRVIAWTVNDRYAAEQLIDLGVDGLCTDDVRLLDDL
ncbi:MAG: glycerophosphoryl diester phosphodiesterase [Gemmatimonadetes bacterium]|nr:glycerophosphoryl diester phosphodiesterase [Gemmatimonadota bacterium]